MNEVSTTDLLMGILKDLTPVFTYMAGFMTKAVCDYLSAKRNYENDVIKAASELLNMSNDKNSMCVNITTFNCGLRKAIEVLKSQYGLYSNKANKLECLANNYFAAANESWNEYERSRHLERIISLVSHKSFPAQFYCIWKTTASRAGKMIQPLKAMLRISRNPKV